MRSAGSAGVLVLCAGDAEPGAADLERDTLVSSNLPKQLARPRAGQFFLRAAHVSFVPNNGLSAVIAECPLRANNRQPSDGLACRLCAIRHHRAYIFYDGKVRHLWQPKEPPTNPGLLRRKRRDARHTDSHRGRPRCDTGAEKLSLAPRQYKTPCANSAEARPHAPATRIFVAACANRWRCRRPKRRSQSR